MDFRLKKEMMDHLRNAIDNSPLRPDINATNTLAGNISKSKFIEDKDNLFYEGVLSGVSEHMYYKDWSNYHDVHIAKTEPNPKFKIKEMWVNYQKQHEFNPPHDHTGMFSFVIFMKIPTHWKEQHALPMSANANAAVASDFAFLLGQGQGSVQPVFIPLSPEDEGRMLFFPSWVWHQVFPFYGTKEERITISGNIEIQQEEEELGEISKTERRRCEIQLEKTERDARALKMMMKKLQSAGISITE